MTAQTREQYIEEQMKRWRAYAQCQCAAHAMAAMRRAADHWDFMKKLDKWVKTPEGRKWKRGLRKMVQQITSEQR